MKKSLSFVLMLFVVLAFAVPAFADAAAMTADDGQAQVKNVQTGARNTSTGWVEVMDSTHAEAAKGKSTGEQLTGVVAGSAIGLRRAIHRTGAGVIDLITFWIPKKQPLVNPETARLE